MSGTYPGGMGGDTPWWVWEGIHPGGYGRLTPEESDDGHNGRLTPEESDDGALGLFYLGFKPVLSVISPFLIKSHRYSSPFLIKTRLKPGLNPA